MGVANGVVTQLSLSEPLTQLHSIDK